MKRVADWICDNPEKFFFLMFLALVVITCYGL